MALDPVFRDQPEKRIRTRIKRFLEERDWAVDVTHGNKYQSGFPDLHCYHEEYGLRWVDAKTPGAFQYTKPQIRMWPRWEAHGCGVWIMFEGDEKNYKFLFEPPNFRKFWKPRYDKLAMEPYEILEEIEWEKTE